MAKKQNSISDRLALTNLETLLKIPLIKRKGLIGVDALISKRAAKFKPSKGFKFYQKEFDGVKKQFFTFIRVRLFQGLPIPTAR